MNFRLARLMLIFVAFAAAFYKLSLRPEPAAFALPVSVPAQVAPQFETHFVSSRLFAQVHAASAIELNDGRIRAYWFSGSREGAHDVQIRGAIFDPATARWSEEAIVVTREQTQQGLQRYISKLGNPVVARAADGHLELFFVTVSLGGWAGSSITALTSADEGATWSAPRRLITSPFFNLSTLVKGTPFLYQDGTMGVPVYHEFIGKFGELLRLGRDGKVLDKQRLAAGGKGSLQPVVLLKNAEEARVLMRYAGEQTPYHAVTVTTRDAGKHWSDPAVANMRNSNSALTGLALADGSMLAVFNDLERGRESLSLMISHDGGENWQELSRLEDQRAALGAQTEISAYQANIARLIEHSDAQIGEKLADYVESTCRTTCSGEHCRYEFSYPYLIQTKTGEFHLVYTWNRTFIKHVRFNSAWLMQQKNHAIH